MPPPTFFRHGGQTYLMVRQQGRTMYRNTKESVWHVAKDALATADADFHRALYHSIIRCWGTVDRRN